MAKEKVDFLAGQAADLEGFSDINSSTIAMPFLKVAQDLSPQLKKTKPNYIEGLKLGDYFNTITGEIYGPEISVIILKFEHMYLEWLPNRGGLVDRHSETNAIRLAFDKTFGKWKTKEGNDLIEYYTYYIIIEGHEAEGPMVLSLKSGDIKEAKALNRLMMTHMMENGQKAMPYWLRWTLKTVLMTKGQNEYYANKFKFKDYIVEQQLQIVNDERSVLPSKEVDFKQLTDGHENAEDADAEYDDSDL